MPYREAGQRAWEEYRLTPEGLDLYPVLVALKHWGATYYADPEGSPREFRHRGCGAGVGVRLTCADGHDLDDVRDVQPFPGPGARPLAG